MINRRCVVSSLAALALLPGCAPAQTEAGGEAAPTPQGAASCKRMAITMDDFNLSFDKVLSPLDRDAAILAAFAKHNHSAAGFVTGELASPRPQDEARARSVIERWSDAGHLIGNHTWSHKNASEEDPALIKADILKNHAYLSQFDGYEKIFRFPFLAEGGQPKKIENYRAFLKAEGFQNGAVTIDSIDWFISARMEQRIRDDPSFDLAAYRDYYVRLVVDISNQKDDLARRLGLQNLPHSLLMHHNILNGLFLSDVMDALAADGWSFIGAREMFAHRLYQLQPKTPTRGRSVLSVLAQEAGVDPNFPKLYYGFGKAEMERRGL